MPRKLEWIYFRKSCATCAKARAYLAGLGWELGDHVIDASRDRIGPGDALNLARKHDQLVAIKGKVVKRAALGRSGPTDDEILSLLMGPTGNLRAPTFKHGKTLVVGYDESAYKDVLGT